MDVSIIIINYRVPNLIINCLKSIYAHTSNITFEIIIVDNDPENGSPEEIISAFPEVRYIHMDYNAGFGRANNKGMSVATGDFFLLLNADTLITDNIIYRCFEKLNARPDIIACGAYQYYADGTKMPFYTSFNDFRKTFFILPPNRILNKVVDTLMPEPKFDDPEQYDWLVGAFVFVRRQGYELTGGFCEDFFMYGEDVEWSWRLGKLGKLCLLENSKFIHLENKNPFRRTRISWINRFSTQMQVSNFLWIRRQYGVLAYLALISHYILMIPAVFAWRVAFNMKESGKPFSEMTTQFIFLRKTRVILKFFFRTLFLKKGLYKIDPRDNIDLLTIT